MKYNSKCVGIDAIRMEDSGKFEVTLIVKDIPQQQLELWKERLGTDIELGIAHE